MEILFFRSSDFCIPSSRSKFSELLAGHVSEGGDPLGIGVRSCRGRVVTVNAHQVGRENSKPILEILSEILCYNSSREGEIRC